MKNLSCSSSKSLNKIFLQNTNRQSRQSRQSHSNSFHKTHLDDIEFNSKKLLDKFYYKNPEFLNDSNIRKQINILLTNVNNIKSKDDKLPKLTFLEDNNKNNNYLSKIKKKYIETDAKEFLPKIKPNRKSRNNNNNSKNNIKINKSVDYAYKSIFPNEHLYKEKTKIVDNKLNLVYCQNELQYKYIMEKQKKLKGANIIEKESEQIKERVDNIKTKVKFMKNVIDYSYPSFLLAKIQIWKKNLEKIKGGEKLLPQEEQKNEIKNKNIKVTNYLKKNFKVYRLKVE